MKKKTKVKKRKAREWWTHVNPRGGLLSAEKKYTERWAKSFCRHFPKSEYEVIKVREVLKK